MEDQEKTIIKIADVAEFEYQTEQFFKQVVPHFQGSNRENILNYLIAELGDNIKQHSQSKKAVLDFSPRNQELADLIISDGGIGIGSSFRKAGLDVNDQEAIKLALRGRSTKKEGNRGWGLRTVAAIVLKLKASLEISSGNARAIVEANKPIFMKVPNRKGTTISLVLPKKIEIPDKIFYDILEGEK